MIVSYVTYMDRELHPEVFIEWSHSHSTFEGNVGTKGVPLIVIILSHNNNKRVIIYIQKDMWILHNSG